MVDTAADEERYVDEPAKDTRVLPAEDERNPYQHDRARVLHSAAFRRLAAKTQVHVAGGGAGMAGEAARAGTFVTDDFLRTRLTHSLRVLTRLEAKVVGPDGASAGLNLTRAALDACTKYPWFRTEGRRKFGVYPDDAPVFAWLRAGAEPEQRCLEAQVMDWADDVAYSVHDVEDGIHGGYIRLARLHTDPDERAALCADVAGSYSAESTADLGAVLDELLDDPVLTPLFDYDGSHPAQVVLKHATSVLTGRLVAAAVAATRAKFGPGPLRRYAADLVVPRRTRAECALLKGLALRYVMRRPGSAERYAHQQEILTGLVQALVGRAPDGLDPVFAPLWRAAPDDPARLRVVVDQVASLTDPAAFDWHRRLVGH